MHPAVNGVLTKHSGDCFKEGKSGERTGMSSSFHLVALNMVGEYRSIILRDLLLYISLEPAQCGNPNKYPGRIF